MNDIDMLACADIETQLAVIADDPEIQHELQEIESEFQITEIDLL